MSVSVAIPATRYVAPRWLQMVAATVGNALEHFDIVVYGYLAVTLSSVFRGEALNASVGSLATCDGAIPSGRARTPWDKSKIRGSSR